MATSARFDGLPEGVEPALSPSGVPYGDSVRCGKATPRGHVRRASRGGLLLMAGTAMHAIQHEPEDNTEAGEDHSDSA